jgi:hypothetical protein
MTDPTFTELECWTRTLNSMIWGQWLMLDTGFRATQTVLAAAAPVAEEKEKEEGGGLLNLALDRMKKGFAPPREIYLTPYREQIDWTAFPDWAKPSNPEMFEGCTHEG